MAKASWRGGVEGKEYLDCGEDGMGLADDADDY